MRRLGRCMQPHVRVQTTATAPVARAPVPRLARLLFALLVLLLLNGVKRATLLPCAPCGCLAATAHATNCSTWQRGLHPRSSVCAVSAPPLQQIGSGAGMCWPVHCPATRHVNGCRRGPCTRRRQTASPGPHNAVPLAWLQLVLMQRVPRLHRAGRLVGKQLAHERLPQAAATAAAAAAAAVAAVAAARLPWQGPQGMPRATARGPGCTTRAGVPSGAATGVPARARTGGGWAQGCCSHRPTRRWSQEPRAPLRRRAATLAWTWGPVPRLHRPGWPAATRGA